VRESTIQADAPIVTLVPGFTVDPEKRRRLMELARDHRGGVLFLVEP